MSNPTTTNKLKQTGIIALVLVALSCVAVVVWWIAVQFLAPDKVVYDTYIVDEIKILDEEEVAGTKNVVELRYYCNENQNGYEMIEIKFNEYFDETKQMTYSQGIQIVANSLEDSLAEGWSFSFKKTPLPNMFGKTVWWGSYDEIDNGSIYTYASADNFNSALNNAQALGEDDDLLIELGDELYLMEFEGKNTTTKSGDRVATVGGQVGSTSVEAYSYNDVYLFAKKMYDEIQSLPNGKSGHMTFKFLDMMQFQRYEDGTYLEQETRDTLKIDRRVQEYYVVKVEKFADGARQASDSLFKAIKGSANFTLDGNYIEDGYFVGKSTINVTQDNFERVLVNDNQIALKLKQDFIDKVKLYKDNIQLSIVIDCDALAVEGYDFIGFTADSAHKNYTIKKCVTVRTVDGQRVEEVIA